MKRILINASHSEEVRVALIDDHQLYDFDIQHGGREQKKANIYKGRIARIEPSLEAAFVDYGAERHGFLPFKEIAREYFKPEAQNAGGRLSIKDAVAEGQEVIVQIEKEERGNKGAALSTFISLAGRYLVLMPNNPRAGGISRRIEGEERAELKEAMAGLNTPPSMGLIVRTAGIGRSTEDLQWDLDQYLIPLWNAIQDAASQRPSPFLLYRESNIVFRAIRDYLRDDTHEVIIDNEFVYSDAIELVNNVMPQMAGRIKLYKNTQPLFAKFDIEKQIESAFQREVKLKSGGSIVIDPTEALVSIDINSSRATKGSDIEETALNTNLEAAVEIAKQLRLRDIGGLIVVDFIDMSPAKNQRDVENKMREALALDRARVQVGRISRFGLLELSRQRLRPSLEESSGKSCPRCNGTGTIRDIASVSLSILRMLEEEAAKRESHEVIIQLPVDIAAYLLNEKRTIIQQLEQRNGKRILLIPNPHFESPHYELRRNKGGEPLSKSSFQLIDKPTDVEYTLPYSNSTSVQQEEAAVKSVQYTAPPPQTNEKKSAAAQKATSYTALEKFTGWFSALFQEEGEVIEQTKKSNSGNGSNNRSQRDKQDNDQRKKGRGRKDNDNEQDQTAPKSNDNRRNGRNRRNNNDNRDNRQDNRGNQSDRNDKNDQQETASGNQSGSRRRPQGHPHRQRQPRPYIAEQEAAQQNNEVQAASDAKPQEAAQAPVERQQKAPAPVATAETHKADEEEFPVISQLPSLKPEGEPMAPTAEGPKSESYDIPESLLGHAIPLDSSNSDIDADDDSDLDNGVQTPKAEAKTEAEVEPSEAKAEEKEPQPEVKKTQIPDVSTLEPLPVRKPKGEAVFLPLEAQASKTVEKRPASLRVDQVTFWSELPENILPKKEAPKFLSRPSNDPREVRRRLIAQKKTSSLGVLHNKAPEHKGSEEATPKDAKAKKGAQKQEKPKTAKAKLKDEPQLDEDIVSITEPAVEVEAIDVTETEAATLEVTAQEEAANSASDDTEATSEEKSKSSADTQSH
ncbi:MAG: Rne/Rng family ribonuclease [Pseudomonadota bacterium]|nr:Rne/Rng family ribonuclease [Pseudomonadota bacterium]